MLPPPLPTHMRNGGRRHKNGDHYRISLAFSGWIQIMHRKIMHRKTVLTIKASIYLISGSPEIR